MIQANKRERLYHHSSEWIGMIDNHQIAHQKQNSTKALVGLVGLKRHNLTHAREHRITPQKNQPLIIQQQEVIQTWAERATCQGQCRAA